MNEEDWLTCPDPAAMLLFLEARTSDRKLRLFVVACCRRIWGALIDERSRQSVETGERWADGVADENELVRARKAAWDAKLIASERQDTAAHYGAYAALLCTWEELTTVNGQYAAYSSTMASTSLPGTT